MRAMRAEREIETGSLKSIRGHQADLMGKRKGLAGRKLEAGRYLRKVTRICCQLVMLTGSLCEP
jgi:hypothetical protein